MDFKLLISRRLVLHHGSFGPGQLAISGQCKAKSGKHRGSGTISSGYQDLQRVSPDAVGKVRMVQSSCSIKGSPEHVTQDCIKMAFEYP